GFALLIQAGGFDPLHKLMAMIDVIHEHAMAAVFEVIANARLSDVEEPALGRLGFCAKRSKLKSSERAKQQAAKSRKAVPKGSSVLHDWEGDLIRGRI